MKTIVIGATGTIGQAVSTLLKEGGHEVIAASRSSPHSVDIEHSASIDDFYAQVDSVDAIICAAGRTSFGALASLTEDQITLGLHSKLLGQINLVRKGLAKLNPNGVMVLTGGMLAYSPWPETSNIAMVNAGLEGFVKAVALELTEGRRIVIVHPPFVYETAQAMNMDATPWPKAATVARTYREAIEGDAHGQAVFVEGYMP